MRLPKLLINVGCFSSLARERDAIAPPITFRVAAHIEKPVLLRRALIVSSVPREHLSRRIRPFS
jgi:hypothetical protein